MADPQFSRGDLVWFDPGIGYVLPGEVTEFHPQAQVSGYYRYKFHVKLRLRFEIHLTFHWHSPEYHLTT